MNTKLFLLPLSVLTLLAILPVASFAIAGGVSGSDEPESRAVLLYTLANPGPVTNMSYRCREISSDGRILTQTRFWLSAQNVRVLKQEVSNATEANSLELVPEAAWDQMDSVDEIIKLKEGAWARTWRLPEVSPQSKEAADHLRQMLESKYGKQNVKEEAVSLGKWYSTPADSLKMYRLNINADAYKNRRDDSGLLKEGKVKISMPVAGQFMELEFDPKTYIKLRQRTFSDQRNVREETWDTHATIDQGQFVISPEAIAGAHGKHLEFVGIGLLLQPSETGPFSIYAVFPNSPASKARIARGELLLSIDGKSTTGMSLSEATALLRGRVGTPVTVVARDSGTKSNQSFTLTRERIVSNGYLPAAGQEADQSTH